MRVGIDVRCLMESRYSGISEYTYNLLSHLFRIDQQNQYFLFYNSSKQPRVPRFDFSNVTYREFKYPNRLFNLSLRFLKLTTIDKLVGGVDVFITPNFLFTNLSPSVRKIMIVHDLTFEIYPEFFTAKKRLWHALIGPRQLCEKAQTVVAISQNTRRDIEKIYKINPAKIKVIYQGINDIFFQPITAEQKNTVRQKYGLPDNYIFYLGNLEPRKNVESLLKAFEKTPDQSVNLVLAGSQAWKYQAIQKIWQNSSSKKRVKFLGYVDAVDKPALYSLAKFLVYPSIYEGFGLPPLEAQACGTPVITSFSSSLVEAIGDSGLLIDPNNITELTQVINHLLADDSLRQELASRGFKNAEKFHWEKTAAEILNLINTP